MARYFIELAYLGTHYSGFQVQENAKTIQSEVEAAFQVLHRGAVVMTGSSRTDSGVHALQNFFHFDYEGEVNPRFVYKMNAILPRDIVIKNLWTMTEAAHCRFDAVSRSYLYKIHRYKDPFLQQTSLYYPYRLDFSLLEKGAALVREQTNFFAFSKTNTQVKNFNCMISESRWVVEGDNLYYIIEGNRFLRGMVRLLTGSLLKLGRGKISLEEFENFFTGTAKSGFAVAGQGLFLTAVRYPENYFPASALHLGLF